MEAFNLKEMIKSSVPILSKSKSCYIKIDSTQKFGEATTGNTSLLGKNYGSTLKSSINSDSNSNGGNSSLEDKKLASSIFNAKLFAIGFLFAGGCAIALYLLAVETHIPNGFALDLISREVWSKAPLIPISSLLNNSKISNILFLQTGGIECLDSESCMDLLRRMQVSENQLKNSEIPYNFLIGSDGQTYEIRGWDYENGFQFIPKSTSLAVGFIGNYTLKSPSVSQLRSASSLINEMKRLKKLNNSFQIYGVRNLTISHLEGDALFRKLSAWPQFDTLLKIL